MKFKPLTAVVIALCVSAVSWIGGSVTQAGMDWYRTITLPSFTPPGSVIGIVWTAIYLMSGIAAYLILTSDQIGKLRQWLLVLLVFNALLNTAWTWLFFGIHWLGTAVVEMVLLNLLNLAIIVLCWKRLRLASLLFIPYFAWVCFATFLAATIWRLNS